MRPSIPRLSPESENQLAAIQAGSVRQSGRALCLPRIQAKLCGVPFRGIVYQHKTRVFPVWFSNWISWGRKNPYDCEDLPERIFWERIRKVRQDQSRREKLLYIRSSIAINPSIRYVNETNKQNIRSISKRLFCQEGGWFFVSNYRSPYRSEQYLERQREASRQARAADPEKARAQWRKDYKAWYHRQLELDPVGFRKAKCEERKMYYRKAGGRGKARQAEQDQTSND